MPRPNTFGLLLPYPSAPTAVLTESANLPMPLENAAGPVMAVEAVAGVAAEALAANNPDMAELAAAASGLPVNPIHGLKFLENETDFLIVVWGLLRLGKTKPRNQNLPKRAPTLPLAEPVL